MDHSEKQLVLFYQVFIILSLSYQQMFLSQMVNINMEVSILLMIYKNHPFNLIQVSFLSFISFIVSSNFKQQVLSHVNIVKEGKEEETVVVKLKPVELMKMSISKGNELMILLTDLEKRMNVNELVIEEGCGNELKIDLKICEFDHLKKLKVKKNSLQNLNSLVISNNDELESIEIDDGEPYDKENQTWYAPFENVKTVEISSIF